MLYPQTDTGGQMTSLTEAAKRTISVVLAPNKHLVVPASQMERRDHADAWTWSMHRFVQPIFPLHFLPTICCRRCMRRNILNQKLSLYNELILTKLKDLPGDSSERVILAIFSVTFATKLIESFEILRTQSELESIGVKWWCSLVPAIVLLSRHLQNNDQIIWKLIFVFI